MGAYACNLPSFDAIESRAKCRWHFPTSDGVILEFNFGAMPGKTERCRQWTRQHGRHIGTDPAEQPEVCDRGLRDHEGVEEPTRRAELLHHALANPLAKMGGINEPLA